MCATPPRPRPSTSFVEVTADGVVALGSFQPRVSSSPQQVGQAEGNKNNRRSEVSSKLSTKDEQDEEWRKLRVGYKIISVLFSVRTIELFQLDALKAEIRRDNAIASFFEKCTSKLETSASKEAAAVLGEMVTSVLGSQKKPNEAGGDGDASGDGILFTSVDPFLGGGEQPEVDL